MMTNLPVSELKANDTVYDIVSKEVANQNSTSSMKLWVGTKAEYDLLTPDNNTIYNITDEGTAENFATKDLSNLSSKGKNITNWSSNVTNCITEIPQDINLELNDGTLTLKAGTKLYIPNGFESNGTTPKFDVITLSQDVVYDDDLWTSDYESIISYSPNEFAWNSHFATDLPRYWTSGPTAPEASIFPEGKDACMWYDTSANKLKLTLDRCVTWNAVYTSLPILTLMKPSTSVTEIRQVFNGFGYIGSTLYALPGVKGLIPDGRNADGSLKSIPFTTSKVLTFTWNTAANRSLTPVVINENELSIGNTYATTNGYRYLEKENILYTNDQNMTGWCYCGDFIRENDRISFFKSSSVYHSLDYNDKSTIVDWGMPSGRYIDLTVGSSGTYYTAPANGYFTINGGTSNTTGNYLGYLQNTSTGGKVPLGAYGYFQGGGIIPVKKGQQVFLWYQSSVSMELFRFVYAEGEV